MEKTEGRKRGDVDRGERAQKREIFNPIGAYIEPGGAALPTPIN